MVLPVSDDGDFQELILVEKDESGALHARDVLPVAFVPLVRAAESPPA